MGIREIKKRIQTETTTIDLMKEYDMALSDMEYEYMEKYREHSEVRQSNKERLPVLIMDIMENRGVKAKNKAEEVAKIELQDDIKREASLHIEVINIKTEIDSHNRTFHL